MRPLTKLFLGIVAIVGLLDAAAFALLLWPVPEAVTYYQDQSQWLQPTLLALTGVTAAVFVIMLLVAILRRSTTSRLALQTPSGELTLDRRAVENTVTKAIVAHHPVGQVDVSVTMRRRQVTRMQVNATSIQRDGLTALATDIEQTAKDAVTASLGVPVKRVNVHLEPAGQQQKGAVRVV
ncbi:alkaline shock response membrane anchor protein AmaP [Lacticaseibacillus pantheris]